VGEDLRSSPCILQETLGGNKNDLTLREIGVFFFIEVDLGNLAGHLVDNNSIASAIRNLTHASVGHPTKLEERNIKIFISNQCNNNT